MRFTTIVAVSALALMADASFAQTDDTSAGNTASDQVQHGGANQYGQRRKETNMHKHAKHLTQGNIRDDRIEKGDSPSVKN